jgi:hypothetical protein
LVILPSCEEEAVADAEGRAVVLGAIRSSDAPDTSFMPGSRGSPPNE